MLKHTRSAYKHMGRHSLSLKYLKPKTGYLNARAKLLISSLVQITLPYKRKVTSIQIKLCLSCCTMPWKIFFFILLPRSEVYDPEFDV